MQLATRGWLKCPSSQRTPCTSGRSGLNAAAGLDAKGSGGCSAAKTPRRSIAPPLGAETATVPKLAGAPAPASTVLATATGAATIVDWPGPALPGIGPGPPGPGAAAPCPVPTPPGWAP